jgi:catechol 2,3-dioxygenase-like lactoylglutathione lyase family enzyme
MTAGDYMVRMGCVLSLLVAVFTAGKPSIAQSSNSNPLKLSPHHATASVADLAKEADWYEHVLGFQRSKLLGEGTGFQMYQMSMPGYRIDLVQQKGSSRHHEAQAAFEQGWLHVVFKTPDIDAAYKHLVAQATDVKAFRDEHAAITRLTFHDPEGNELEIVRE